MPSVAIVGRPNVGKSTLFNRLIGKKIAIVHDQPGVTRDRVSAIFEITAPDKSKDMSFELVDTGGIGSNFDQEFAESIISEANFAIKNCDIILFVVDALSGLNPIDSKLAETLRKEKIPIILVINKSENIAEEFKEIEFAKLGFQSILGISAEHNIGIDKLKTKLAELSLSFEKENTEKSDSEIDANNSSFDFNHALKIAIIGRPNVGKSTLINTILNENRTIVSDIAGTTRDAVDVPFRPGLGSMHMRDYLLIDTAGVRRRNKVDSSIEFFSINRTLKSIERADLVILLLTAVEGITAQDKKIAKILTSKKKPTIVAFNKYDLFLPDNTKSERMNWLKNHFKREMFFLNYAPLVIISAEKKQYVNLIFSTIDKMLRASSQLVNTSKLNDIIAEATLKNPPPVVKGKRLKVYYASFNVKKNLTQELEDSEPSGNDIATRNKAMEKICHIKLFLFINNKQLVRENYINYLEKYLRSKVDLGGLPIKFITKIN